MSWRSKWNYNPEHPYRDEQTHHDNEGPGRKKNSCKVHVQCINTSFIYNKRIFTIKTCVGCEKLIFKWFDRYLINFIKVLSHFIYPQFLGGQLKNSKS